MTGEHRAVRCLWSLLLVVIPLLLATVATQAQSLPPNNESSSSQGGDSLRRPVLESTEERAENRWSHGGGTLAGIDTVIISGGARNFLEPNFPNPFGPGSRQTTIFFSVAKEGMARVRIYDFLYEEVATLHDQVTVPGRYRIAFDALGTMPSGIYFYELKTDDYRELRRMIYIK